MKLGAKFWTIVIDAVVSLVSVLVTFYLAPDYAKLVLTIVGILQVPIVALIAAIYGENAAKIRADADMAVARYNLEAAKLKK